MSADEEFEKRFGRDENGMIKSFIYLDDEDKPKDEINLK